MRCVIEAIPTEVHGLFKVYSAGLKTDYVGLAWLVRCPRGLSLRDHFTKAVHFLEDGEEPFTHDVVNNVVDFRAVAQESTLNQEISRVKRLLEEE